MCNCDFETPIEMPRRALTRSSRKKEGGPGRLYPSNSAVSTDKQNPLSPADQERKCRDYADRNGITVVSGHVYCDEGLSGVGLDRPSLQRLLRVALARPRDIDVIRLCFNNKSAYLRELEYGRARREKLNPRQLCPKRRNGLLRR